MKKGRKSFNENNVPASGELPIWKRFVAYMVDWYLGSIFTSLPMVMIYMKATNTQDLNTNLFQYPKQYALMAGALGLLFGFFYYLIVPLLIWKGQTLGKHWCHFKIVKKNCQDVSFKQLFLRQIIGIFLVEGALIFPSNLFHQILSFICNVNLITPLNYVGIAISIISGLLVLIRKDHRAIHDLIASTKVISVLEK